MDWTIVAAKQGKKIASILPLIREDPSIDLYKLSDDEIHEQLLVAGKKIAYYQSEVQRASVTPDLNKEEVRTTILDNTHPWNEVETKIRQWLNKNLFEKRLPKQRQLWLYSSGPNVGKTSLVNWLENYLRIYRPVPGEDWDDNYKDGSYDCIVLDEYIGGKPFTYLNSLLEGNPMRMRVRGEAARTKTDNLPVIVLSNKNPLQCYPNISREHMETMLARLFIVKVSEPMTVFLTLGNPEGLPDDGLGKGWRPEDDFTVPLTPVRSARGIPPPPPDLQLQRQNAVWGIGRDLHDLDRFSRELGLKRSRSEDTLSQVIDLS